MFGITGASKGNRRFTNIETKEIYIFFENEASIDWKLGINV